MGRSAAQQSWSESGFRMHPTDMRKYSDQYCCYMCGSACIEGNCMSRECHQRRTFGRQDDSHHRLMEPGTRATNRVCIVAARPSLDCCRRPMSCRSSCRSCTTDYNRFHCCKGRTDRPPRQPRQARSGSFGGRCRIERRPQDTHSHPDQRCCCICGLVCTWDTGMSTRCRLPRTSGHPL